jgi:hypothetical protein
LEKLAIDASIPPAIISDVALYKMTPWSDHFEHVSIPIVEGPYPDNLTDKGWLTIGRDGGGKRHFYITYMDYKKICLPTQAWHRWFSSTRPMRQPGAVRN